MLHNTASRATFPMPNANRNDPENPGHDPGAILTELCRLCSAEPEGLGLAREIRADRESESLATLFDAKGALWTEAAPPQSDELTGGEHLVYLDESHARVFKATKPGKFGFSVGPELVRGRDRRTTPRITVGLIDATPAEYLARLAWQNELFGDRIRVHGMVVYPGGSAVLTTQPFVWGERTPQDLIDQWFQASDWLPLPRKEGAFYHPLRDLLILDALPRNVLTRPDSAVFPFDVVIVRPSPDLKWSLRLTPPSP
jgi:hypothetical protein